MYQQGDKMLEVRELLVKAFATAWKNSDPEHRPRYLHQQQHYRNRFHAGAAGNDLRRRRPGPDRRRGTGPPGRPGACDGTWVYYGVPAENFFIVTWMPDAKAAEAKIAALREEGDCVACCVDLAEEWNFG